MMRKDQDHRSKLAFRPLILSIPVAVASLLFPSVANAATFRWLGAWEIKETTFSNSMVQNGGSSPTLFTSGPIAQFGKTETRIIALNPRRIDFVKFNFNLSANFSAVVTREFEVKDSQEGWDFIAQCTKQCGPNRDFNTARLTVEPSASNGGQFNVNFKSLAKNGNAFKRIIDHNNANGRYRVTLDLKANKSRASFLGESTLRVRENRVPEPVSTVAAGALAIAGITRTITRKKKTEEDNT